MGRLRVLVFANSFRRGGSERQALELFRNLDRSKYDARLATASTDGPLRALLPCHVEDVQVYPLVSFKDASFVESAVRFYRYLRHEQIDVVQCFDFYSNLLAIPVARMAQVPIVLGARREESTVKTPMQRRIQRWVYRLAKGVVANAGSIRDLLIKDEQLPPPSVWAIPNGLDLEAFDNAVTQSRCQRNEKLVQFAVIANLRPEKGHQIFLEAVARIAAQHPESRFLIAGEGPMRGAIETTIRRLRLEQTVELVGEVQDVPAFLTAIDGVVLPSISNEGFPNAVMEAMAASLPVVATDSGGTRDLVVEGETGFVVPTNNVGALASKIEMLCRDKELRRKMGEAGRWRIATCFTTRHMARQYEALYEMLRAKSMIHSS